MPSATVSDNDVIALGRKIDEFAEVLTEKERLMMLAMIRAARQHFLAMSSPPSSTTPPTKPTLPKLGPAFDAAFLPGRAAEFDNQSEFSIGPVEITGSVTGAIK